MIYVCVICMVKRPPLTPLSPEHRALLEAIVSPVINTEELKDWHWLHCADCKILMQSIYNFQETALKGVKNLKYLFSELNKAVNIAAGANPKVVKTTYKPETLITVPLEREENLKIPFKIEPEVEVQVPSLKKEPINATGSSNADPLMVELEVKCEPESHSEPDPEPECDSESTLSCDFDHDESNPPTHTIVSASSPVTVRVVPKLPAEPVKSDEKFEMFTHGKRPRQNPGPSQPGPYLTSIRWKGGVGEPLGHKVGNKYIYERKPPQRVTCPHCDKSLCNDGLKLHMARSHGEIRPCECDVCGRQCRNETALKLHKYSVHTYKEIKASRDTIDTMRPELFCTECCKQLASPSAYRIHLMTRKHTPKEHYKFECETCSAKFLDERRLQQHVEVVHLRQGAYKCEKCDRTYASKKGVRKHNIDAHEKRPRSKPPLICHLCGKTFTIRKSLSEHLLKHEGLRPHQCPLCPATFTYKAALYTHNRLKHLNIKRKRKKKVDRDGEESAESSGSDGGKIKRKKKVGKEGEESAETSDSDGVKIKRKKKKVGKEGEEESAESCDSDGGKIKRKKVEEDGEESAESSDGDGVKIKRKKGGEASAESCDSDGVKIKRKKGGEASAESCDSDGGKIKRKWRKKERRKARKATTAMQ